MPIVRQVALDNVPLRNGPSSQKFSEEPMFIFFLQWELIIIIQIKWLILLLLDHGILYKPPKWPVLYDKCIRKSMVVCNLHSHATQNYISTFIYELIYQSSLFSQHRMYLFVWLFWPVPHTLFGQSRTSKCVRNWLVRNCRYAELAVNRCWHGKASLWNVNSTME